MNLSNIHFLYTILKLNCPLKPFHLGLEDSANIIASVMSTNSITVSNTDNLRDNFWDIRTMLPDWLFYNKLIVF